MSCFCVYNFRVRFPYESSCFWLGNLLSRFPNEISCFLALMRFHEISLLYFTLFFSIPDEISLWDFMLFGRCKISLWEFMLFSCIIILCDFMLLGCKACMRVSSGEGGVMQYVEKGRHAFWALWDFLMSFHAFLALMKFLYESSCFWLQNLRWGLGQGLGGDGIWDGICREGAIVVGCGCEWSLPSFLAIMRFPYEIFAFRF
jgi:hypothetical protein